MSARDADVIVVGLGAMGAAVLYQLSRLGMRALGLEQFVSPHAHGSSHGQTRITRRATGEGPECAPFVDASHRIWRQLEAEVDETLFVECGVLVAGPASGGAEAHGQADFVGETLAVARARGIAHERLDACAIRARFPMFAGIDDRTIGCFEPGGGYVFPERCIAAQLGRAVELGAGVRSGTRVVGLREARGGVEVHTTAGTLRARRAVIAAGAWCGPLLGAPFDALLTVRRQLLHWFEIDPDAAAGFDVMPAFIRFHGGAGEHVFYGFPPVAGEAAIKVATEQHETETTADTVDRAVDAAEARAMHARHVAPCLVGVRPRTARESVACVYAVTPDHRFVIDAHPSMPSVTVVSACSGHGFKHSAGIGLAVAQALLGDAPSADLAPFALDRASLDDAVRACAGTRP